MQAIRYATIFWEVDIIAMPSGFVHDHEEMVHAIQEANIAKVLVFAAAANHGNVSDIAFPARLQGYVMGMFSSTGNVKPSQEFNPSASGLSTRNFCILGEEVDVNCGISRETKRESGTSFATSIAAAIAGRIIDFSRHDDLKQHVQNRNKLKTVGGMSEVFSKMAKRDGDYLCISPWRIADCPLSMAESNDLEKRKWVWDTIYRAFDAAHTG
jgi:hypothetical protein